MKVSIGTEVGFCVVRHGATGSYERVKFITWQVLFGTRSSMRARLRYWIPTRMYRTLSSKDGQDNDQVREVVAC